MSQSKSFASEDGLEAAATITASIIGPANELSQPQLEDLCRIALQGMGKRAVLERHEQSKSLAKKAAQEKKVLEITLPSVTTMSATQVKNHSIRFGLEEGPSSLIQRHTWAFTGAKNNFFGTSGDADSREYEDIISMDILRAPITDICIIQRGDPMPDGFFRLSRTPGSKKANLNSQSGGNHIFICLKKEVAADAVPITSLCVIFPDKNEFVPPGFFVVRRGKHACNLNTGTASERIFLCYKKDKSGNPIVDVQVIVPSNKEDPPKGFSMIDRSPTGF